MNDTLSKSGEIKISPLCQSDIQIKIEYYDQKFYLKYCIYLSIIEYGLNIERSLTRSIYNR